MAYQPYYARSHALVVGIDAYAALPPLQTASHDAKATAQYLTDSLGFEVRLLCDSDATRDAILGYLIDDLAKTGPDDRVLVYFAGHGVTRRAADGSEIGLLLPVGFDPEHYSSAIEMDHLVDQSKYIPAKHILFVLDACFSGLAITRAGGAGRPAA